MIVGAHSIIYSTNAEADRAFLRDVLGLSNVDGGGGWLIFGLPPAEVAVHPSDRNDVHEFYLMCDDVEAFVADMTARQIECGALQDQGWGVLTQITLPGGGKLGVYQPRHARPPVMGETTVVQKVAAPARRKPAARKPVKKVAQKVAKPVAKPAGKKTGKAAGKKPAAKPARKPAGKRSGKR